MLTTLHSWSIQPTFSLERREEAKRRIQEIVSTRVCLLSLADCRLSHLPNIFMHIELHHLTELNLSYNPLLFIPASIYHLIELRTIYLSHCDALCDLPYHEHPWPNLEECHIESCKKLSTRALPLFAKLPSSCMLFFQDSDLFMNPLHRCFVVSYGAWSVSATTHLSIHVLFQHAAIQTLLKELE